MNNNWYKKEKLIYPTDFEVINNELRIKEKGS